MKDFTLKYRRKNREKAAVVSESADSTSGAAGTGDQPVELPSIVIKDDRDSDERLVVRGEDLTPRGDQDQVERHNEAAVAPVQTEQAKLDDLDAVEIIEKLEQDDQVQLDEIRPFLGSPIHRINNSINQLDKKLTRKLISYLDYEPRVEKSVYESTTTTNQLNEALTFIQSRYNKPQGMYSQQKQFLTIIQLQKKMQFQKLISLSNE
jgi:hypothetical protein